MPALNAKLAGSLLVGAMCGVAALVTLSSTGTQLAPASDSNATAPQGVVQQTAACPPGTVERPDACLRLVKVAPPEEAVPVAQPVKAAPLRARTAPAAVPVPAAAPVAKAEPSREDSPEPEHESEPAESQDGPETDD
jgi:hypothetical protein